MTSYKAEYKKIKHSIIATRNPNVGVADFFYYFSPEKVRKYVASLNNEAFFRNAIMGKAFPTQLSYLGKCGNMRQGTVLKNALLWTAMGIASCKQSIDSFLIEKDIFDQCHSRVSYD